MRIKHTEYSAKNDIIIYLMFFSFVLDEMIPKDLFLQKISDERIHF